MLAAVLLMAFQTREARDSNRRPVLVVDTTQHVRLTDVAVECGHANVGRIPLED